AITDRVDVVVCPDDLNIAKPDPRPLLHACQQVGADPACCIYVGDHLRDIEAGKAAGMKTIAASYGYIEDPASVPEWQADYLLEKSAEISKLFSF
ncbi:MAG: HAD-IA family hydrolase, partial [Oceanospirillum sp.]|nr:HAD-IA family hydrolase [Oceanospirillum sp.]